ncbi:dynamin family protein [Frankia torreyi]|uniref:Dynamin family protein n=2 Tax=Frankia TaxID=1854 RepID=A0A0D8BAS9_9ACTN|nr:MULTISPECIES: dynamin family protein [Frankia]KJE20487.1 dynamin family protein [Frankia torreyi]KQC39037.1 hypothetical protein UK82_07600 [Frankia sp. ACN1ag]
MKTSDGDASSPGGGRFFADNADRLAGLDDAEPVARCLRQAQERLDQPMRVAVAGQLKRGKSTLVNALLGETVAATGQLELTFNVNELVYSDEPAAVVRYQDGRSVEVDPADLHRWTVRDPERLADLRAIRSVELGLPHRLLRTFRLVDTPGLGSVDGVDAANTHDALGTYGDPEAQRRAETLATIGRTEAGMHADSAAEVNRADAVLFLFARSPHERDLRVVTEFVGSGSAATVTALKAFGVLSRCDEYWPPQPDLPGDHNPMTYDPMAAASQIAARLGQRSALARLFFAIVPVAGLVAEGAQTLPAASFDVLADLAAADPKRLALRLGDTAFFATRESLPGIRVPVEQRRDLILRLGAWGIHRACGYLRDGLGEAEVRQRLLADSGVERLRSLIVDHFGNRATLIKMDGGLRDLENAIVRLRREARQAGRPVPAAVDALAGRVENLRSNDHSFAELSVLSALYAQELDLSSVERDELLRVTGEYGQEPTARLGLDPAASAADQLAAATARIRWWAGRSADPLLDRETVRAARTVLRSYERLAHGAARPRSDGEVVVG